MAPRNRNVKKAATKRTVRKKAATASPLAVLGALLPALSAYYTDSYLAPGVVIAYLPQKGQFYASVARYPRGPHGECSSRVVHNKIFADTLEELITKLAHGWYNQSAPLLTLGKLLRTVL